MITNTLIVLLLTITSQVSSTSTSTSTPCSLSRLQDIQDQFRTCSRRGRERQEEEEPCQEMEQVVVECGDLWRPCLSSLELRRMRDREMEKILRRAGTTERYENCATLLEYRSL